VRDLQHGATIFGWGQSEKALKEMMEVAHAVKPEFYRHGHNLGFRLTQEERRLSYSETVQKVCRRLIVVLSEGLAKVAWMATAAVMDALYGILETRPTFHFIPKL
jgi:hypothetical protein